MSTRATARLREDAVRKSVLDAIHAALFTPEAVAFLRKCIVDGIRNAGANVAGEETALSDRLRRTKERIRGLITFIADGDHSQNIRDTLRDLEAQARIDDDALQSLRALQKPPVQLPSPEVLLQRAHNLERVILADPTRGREALRNVLEHGKITMQPNNDGTYRAEFGFLALTAVGAAGQLGASRMATACSITVPKPADRRRKG